jgi:hypothetical protein
MYVIYRYAISPSWNSDKWWSWQVHAVTSHNIDTRDDYCNECIWIVPGTLSPDDA